jgi:hypothetical protein
LEGFGICVGAVAISFIADVSSLSVALHVVAWISLGSGIFVLVFVRETITRPNTTNEG